MSTSPVENSFNSAHVAQLLFGNDLYREYIEWQATIDDPSKIHHYGSRSTWGLLCDNVQGNPQGEVPDVYTYKAFMNCLRLEGKLYPPIEKPRNTSLTIATRCHHTIHPGNLSPSIEACPVCVMKQCGASLTRIWNVWERLGGPDRNFNPTADQALYFKVKSIFCMEKKRWANLVAKYEELGEGEDQWENWADLSTTHTFEGLNRVQSCREAIRIAWESNPNGGEGYDAHFTPRPLKSTTNPPVGPSAFMSSPPPGLPVPGLPGSPSQPSNLENEISHTPPSDWSFTKQPTSCSQPSPPSAELPTLEPESSGFSEYITRKAIPGFSSTLTSSSPLPCIPKGEKKVVRFVDDVEEHENWDVASFYETPSSYHSERRIYAVGGRCEDMSFKNPQCLGQGGSREGISQPRGRHQGTVDERMKDETETRIVNAHNTHHDFGSESESETDSSSSLGSGGSAEALTVDEKDRTALRQSQYLPNRHTCAKKMRINGEFSTVQCMNTDSNYDSESDVIENDGAEGIMSPLNPGKKPARVEVPPDWATNTVSSELEDVDMEPPAPGRRDRSMFEEELPQITGGTVAKRQRRGSN